MLPTGAILVGPPLEHFEQVVDAGNAGTTVPAELRD